MLPTAVDATVPATVPLKVPFRERLTGVVDHARRGRQPGEAAEPASSPPSMFTSVPVT